MIERFRALEWQRINDYCLRSGKYRVTKFGLSGETWFAAYAGDERLGMWRKASKAREVAQQHSNNESV